MVLRLFRSFLCPISRRDAVLRILGIFLPLWGGDRVYVARKRDKFRNRFGFVSFNGVRDAKDLEVSLKNLKMGSNKLVVNITRFAAENIEVNKLKGKNSSQPHAGLGGVCMGGSSHNRNFSSSVKGGMSYKESLMGREKNDGKEDKVVEISSYVKPLEEWSKSSLIVRVSDLTTLVNLDKILSEAIGPNIKLKYVGGFYMLLLFEKVEYLYEFRDFNPNLKVWFSWFEVWKGQILPFEQIAWLKISGVPLHVLDNEVFDSVGRLYGKVVHALALNGDDKDLSFDLVGILVGDGEKISDRVTLMWKDKKIKVWVEEESSDWTLDCISDDGSWSDAEVSDGARGKIVMTPVSLHRIWSESLRYPKSCSRRSRR
ncbi:hypothetical protein HanRHA438_Chr04g0164581 [Helianthus annuus]|nr:hypothetical protein HanHA89_Chr04g0139891 [Helianthus annuus]KAJ0756840.1 hypothetical protein HanLR1_Chr04g0131661 [Helianthus annuus]KAJ0925870.1 hypothetical protein HanRHA438_Chr04g0164581 [Helianthus annuus]